LKKYNLKIQHCIKSTQNPFLKKPCTLKIRLVYSSEQTILTNQFRVRSRGLVVKAEDSVPGYKPLTMETIFRHISFGSKLGTKIVENSKLALVHVL
jgi:hypothetical protein